MSILAGASPAGAQLPLGGLLNQIVPVASPAPAAQADSGGSQPVSSDPKPAQPAPAQVRRSTTSTPGGAFPLRVPWVNRTSGRSTAALMGLIDSLAGAGFSREDALRQAVPPFPVAGVASYSDDWLMPRVSPEPHLHQGNDIFAPVGTPILASGPGRVLDMVVGGAGGITVWVIGDDQTAYYYAHLRSYARGLRAGQQVQAGTLLGFVGLTGNATGGASHLHFEVHPAVRSRSGDVIASGMYVPARDPKGVLDGWLDKAEANATSMLQARLGPGGPARAVRSALSSRELIALSPLDPSLGALGFAGAAFGGSDLFQGLQDSGDEDQQIYEARLAVETYYANLDAVLGVGTDYIFTGPSTG